MRRIPAWAGLLAVCLPLSVAAGVKNYRVAGEPGDMYFGHVSYVDPGSPGVPDALVLRSGGGEPRAAVLNLPIVPGDLVRTPAGRRLEIQFDTGTLLRLEGGSELRVEAVLAPTLSRQGRYTNLVLERGVMYLMYKKYASSEAFQVKTPVAAAKLRHETVALVRAADDGATDVQVDRGKATVMFGEAGREARTSGAEAREAAGWYSRGVGRGERLVVLADGQAQLAEAVADSEFAAWNKRVNDEFVALHAGVSGLPKPIRNLPPAVHYFAQKYGNQYGEWIWDDMYGYVWQPHVEGWYPGGRWTPAVYGSWESIAGRMFWVPGEPWGWVPYHLGLWQWDKKLGWVWLPGSLFAPAWVDWDFLFGYGTWRPWSLFDWAMGDMFSSYWMVPAIYGDIGSRIPPSGLFPKPPAIGKIGKDQLKAPRQPVPRELRDVVARVQAGLKSGVARLTESVREHPQGVVVRAGDLNAPRIHERILAPGDLPRLERPAGPRPEAGRTASSVFRLNEALRAPAARIPAAPLTTPEPRGSGGRTPALPGWGRLDVIESRTGGGRGGPRLDWNPDVRIARAMGVSIRYENNTVVCPELDIRALTGGIMGPGGSFISSSPFTSSASSGGSGPASAPGSGARGGDRAGGSGAQGGKTGDGTKK